MYLKYITNFNLKANPWFSFCNYSEWKTIINEKMSNNIDNDNLIVYCVQETYGYRAGMFGFLSHSISTFLPFQSFYLKQFMNSNIRYYQSNNIFSSDGEILSSFISKINRYIPFFNIGTWDYKNQLLMKNFFYENNSIPHMFDFTSPMLDSGCGIFSNQIPFESGYEPLDFVGKKLTISDNLSSKGMVWSFFTNNVNKGITVISFNLSDDLFELSKLLELEQIISLKNKLQNRFGLMVNEYETYIVGDFKIKFSEDSESFIQLTEGMIINYSDNTNYLLYQKECPDENGIQMKEETKDEIKEETKQDFREEIKVEFKVSDDKVSTDFVNIFNPLNNYFSNPSTSPSSSSHSSGEWVHI
jgi:DNA-directed RNA polymerase subunit E'/Rpb7